MASLPERAKDTSGSGRDRIIALESTNQSRDGVGSTGSDPSDRLDRTDLRLVSPWDSVILDEFAVENGYERGDGFLCLRPEQAQAPAGGVDDLKVPMIEGGDQCGDAILAFRINLHESFQDSHPITSLFHKSDQDRHRSFRRRAEPRECPGNVVHFQIVIVQMTDRLNQHRHSLSGRRLDIRERDCRRKSHLHSLVNECSSERGYGLAGFRANPGEQLRGERITVSSEPLDKLLQGRSADARECDYQVLIVAEILVEEVIQDRQRAFRVWPDPTECDHRIAAEHLVLVNHRALRDRADERGDGFSRRRSHHSQGLDRRLAHLEARTIQHPHERRHCRCPDLDHGVPCSCAVTGHSARREMPALADELLDQSWNAPAPAASRSASGLPTPRP